MQVRDELEVALRKFYQNLHINDPSSCLKVLQEHAILRTHLTHQRRLLVETTITAFTKLFMKTITNEVSNFFNYFIQLSNDKIAWNLVLLELKIPSDVRMLRNGCQTKVGKAREDFFSKLINQRQLQMTQTELENVLIQEFYANLNCIPANLNACADIIHILKQRFKTVFFSTQQQLEETSRKIYLTCQSVDGPSKVAASALIDIYFHYLDDLDLKAKIAKEMRLSLNVQDQDNANLTSQKRKYSPELAEFHPSEVQQPSSLPSLATVTHSLIFQPAPEKFVVDDSLTKVLRTIK